MGCYSFLGGVIRGFSIVGLVLGLAVGLLRGWLGLRLEGCDATIVSLAMCDVQHGSILLGSVGLDGRREASPAFRILDK